MTIEVGGRKFTFKVLTLAFLKKYHVAKMEQFFSGIDFEKLLDNEETYKTFGKKWREFCDIAFVQDWKWKIGLRPKELELETMPLAEIARIAKSFFGYVGDGMK